MRGEDAAYREFHDIYFDRLFRYLLVVARGDEQAAREAMQAALTRVVRHIRVFNEEAVFWSWLTVVGRSALGDERRKRRRYFAFLDRFARHAEAERDRAGAEDGDGRLAVLLRESVDRLSDDERQLLAWKYSERQSVREIAARLGATGKSVESRLGRIREKLRERLLARLKHDSDV